MLSSHGGSTTQGFFWPVVEKRFYVDVIEVILALVYLMTAKCYVLSMSFLLLLNVGTVKKKSVYLSAFSFHGVQILLAAHERGC